MQVPSEARGNGSPWSGLTWALGPEFRSYGGAAHTLSRWATSPATFVDFCPCLSGFSFLLISARASFFLPVQRRYTSPPASAPGDLQSRILRVGFGLLMRGFGSLPLGVDLLPPEEPFFAWLLFSDQPTAFFSGTCWPFGRVPVLRSINLFFVSSYVNVDAIHTCSCQQLTLPRVFGFGDALFPALVHSITGLGSSYLHWSAWF